MSLASAGSHTRSASHMPSGRTPKCGLEVVRHHGDLPARVALGQDGQHRLVEAAAEELDLAALDQRAQLVEVVGPLALDPLEERAGVVQGHLHRAGTRAMASISGR